MKVSYDNAVRQAETNFIDASDRLSNIRIENYAYTVTMHRTEKKRIVKAWKWTYNKDIHHSWQEVRHHHDKFNRDLDAAEGKKDQAYTQLEDVYSNAIQGIRANISKIQSAVSKAQSANNVAHNAYRAELARCNAARSKVSNEKIKATNLKQKLKNDQVRLQQLNQQKLNTEKEIIEKKNHQFEVKKQTLNILLETTIEQRSEMFASFYRHNNEQMKQMINLLLDKGIDIGYVACLAVRDGRSDLLDYVINKGVDFDVQAILEDSLVKYAINNNSPLLAKILGATKDFTCSILGFIKDKDYSSMDIVLNHNKYMLHSLIEGISLLQIAISAGASEVVKYLLSKDATIAAIKSSNNDSAYIFALRNGKEEIIKEVANHTDIKKEIIALSIRKYVEDSTELIKKAAQLNSEKIDSIFIYHILTLGNLEAVSLLIAASQENVTDIYLNISMMAAAEDRDDLMQQLDSLEIIKSNLLNDVNANELDSSELGNGEDDIAELLENVDIAEMDNFDISMLMGSGDINQNVTYENL